MPSILHAGSVQSIATDVNKIVIAGNNRFTAIHMLALNVEQRIQYYINASEERGEKPKLSLIKLLESYGVWGSGRGVSVNILDHLDYENEGHEEPIYDDAD